MGVRPRVLATRHVPGCLVASVYATIGCLITAGETSCHNLAHRFLTCAQWLAVKKRSCQRSSTCSAPMHSREVQRRVTLGVCWSGLNPWLSQEQVDAAVMTKSCRPVQRRAACTPVHRLR